jgi:hypothetical protein
VLPSSAVVLVFNAKWGAKPAFFKSASSPTPVWNSAIAFWANSNRASTLDCSAASSAFFFVRSARARVARPFFLNRASIA